MRKLVERFRRSFDFVLIDTGPVLGSPDAMALAPLVDAVLVVVNSKQTTRSAALRARKQLELVDARVMGTVLYDPGDEADEDYYGNYEPYSFVRGEPSGNGEVHGTAISAPRAEPQRPPSTDTRRQPERYEAPRQAPPVQGTTSSPSPDVRPEIDLRSTPLARTPEGRSERSPTADVDQKMAVEHPREGV